MRRLTTNPTAGFHPRQPTNRNMKAARYKITKTFIGGILHGMTIEEQTTVKFEEGFVCRKPSGGSPYKITKVEVLP